MGKLNDPGCSTGSGMNTGVPSCVTIPKTITGIILIPKTMSLAAADLVDAATALAKLQEWTLNPPATRAYPIGPFAEIALKNEEAVYNTTGYAVKQFVREGKIGWQFGLPAGGIQYQKKIRSFNHTKAFKVLFYDEDNRLYGCDDGNGGMKGFAIDELYALPWTPSDGSKPTQFLVDLFFASTAELSDYIQFIDMETDIAGQVLGLIDVTIEKLAQTSTYATFTVKTSVAGVNLYSQYKTALAAAGAWVVTKAGTPVTPDSVEAVDATESFKITLTTPTGAHVFSLATPAALEALSIGGAPDNGYESNSVTVTFS